MKKEGCNGKGRISHGHLQQLQGILDVFFHCFFGDVEAQGDLPVAQVFLAAKPEHFPHFGRHIPDDSPDKLLNLFYAQQDFGGGRRRGRGLK